MSYIIMRIIVFLLKNSTNCKDTKPVGRMTNRFLYRLELHPWESLVNSETLCEPYPLRWECTCVANDVCSVILKDGRKKAVLGYK